MKHLWLRAEHRENEKRVGLTPQGATQLIKEGIKVSVEESDTRIISTKDYKDAGCEIVSAGSWENAPEDAIIFGLKELPNNDTPCLLYTSPSPRDRTRSRMPSSA